MSDMNGRWREYLTHRTHRIVFLVGVTIVGVVLLLVASNGVPPGAVRFSQSATSVEVYDFVEVTIRVSRPHAINPFTDVAVRGTFGVAGGENQWRVEGFCDAADGTVYRIRFMPTTPGDYAYAIQYRQGLYSSTSTGKFHVVPGGRRGPIRIDPQNRWHFVWEGTGEHYFFNGTTAYWLIGWRDERVIESAIERFRQLKINRVRVTIAGRTAVFYGEPVMAGPDWTPFLEPWPPARGPHFLHLLGRLGQRVGMGVGRASFEALADLGVPDDIYHPGFDYSRFQVSHWQKFERALRFARDRDVIFSLVLDMNTSRVHPEPGSVDEQLFIRYAVARFAAFSNITWDLGDDLDQYRSDEWTHVTGVRLKEWDPYQHLATSHPGENAHQDRASDWFDFTSFQEWSRAQHAFMLDQRRQQERLGRIIPQTNEEYGYEDHYPMWAKGVGSESADALRRAAWDIVMAGGYQTTGETARRGTHIWPDTGGGWMNGRGDDTMRMFEGYARMADFFTGFEWWKTEPHDELVSGGNYCLARSGEIYAVYLPHGGHVTVRLEPGEYDGTWFNATTGAQISQSSTTVGTGAPRFTAPSESEDWALLLRKR